MITPVDRPLDAIQNIFESVTLAPMASYGSSDKARGKMTAGLNEIKKSGVRVILALGTHTMMLQPVMHTQTTDLNFNATFNAAQSVS